ncbi:MAG: hypothetical protein MOB07_27100 [Acidobacteria bacterium]|nr:hypothetical protein [Acidobacteriota bacterium]
MVSGGTGIELIDQKRASEIVRSFLLGNSASQDQLAVDCAALRHTLWDLSRGGKTPVHIRRLLNTTVQLQLDSLDTPEIAEQKRRERIRDALDELSEVYDLVSLPNGYWIPAPAREVPIASQDDVRLLIGGIPTTLIPAHLSVGIDHQGPFRRIKGSGVGKTLKLPVEPLEYWIGMPPEDDIRVWSREVLEKAALANYSEPPEGSRFQIYLPQKSRAGSPQALRWQDIKPQLPAGRYLARRNMAFGAWKYRIIQVERGHIISSGDPETGFGDIRRLMYGLDSLADNPVKVQLKQGTKEICALIRSELPRAERRRFASIGNLVIPTDEYYPRKWNFDLAYKNIVKECLHKLGVRIE